MNNYLILTLLLIFTSCGQVLGAKKSKSMKNINFIPEKFNDIKLWYYQAQMNECSPNYPNKIIQLNTITINVPQTILFNGDSEKLTSIIPVCASYIVSLKRVYKYSDLSEKMLHIKNIDKEEVFTEEIVDKMDYGMKPLVSPNY